MERNFYLTFYISNIYVSRCVNRVVRQTTDKLLISIRLPGSLLALLDQGARRENSNRSQFIRDAVQEKLARRKAAATRTKNGTSAR